MTSPTQTVSIFFFMRDIFCIKFCIRQSMKRATVLKISKEIERNQRLYKATFEVTKTVHGSQWLEFNFTMIVSEIMQSFSRARFSRKYLEKRVLSKFIKDANFCKVLDNLKFKLKRDINFIWYMAVITQHQLPVCFNEQGFPSGLSNEMRIHKHSCLETSCFKFSESLGLFCKTWWSKYLGWIPTSPGCFMTIF